MINGELCFQPSTELHKKKEKKKKKVENEKKSWSTSNSEQGRMEIDDILAYLGEDNANSSEGGNKKRDKRDNKKDASSADKKKEKDNSFTISNINKKKDNQSTNRKKQSKQANVPISSSNIQFNSSNSEIIQTTTSNNGQISRIILNGSDEGLELSDKPYSERDIDKAIEESKAKVEALKTSHDCATVAPSFGAIEETATLINDSQPEKEQTSQTINVSFNINLNEEPLFVEEEFVRIKTPEPVEEEFREVVHKKKKNKQSVTDKENTNSTVSHQPVSNLSSTNKLPIKITAKPKPAVDHKPNAVSNMRSSSPPRKMSEVVKEKPSSTDGTQYDFSEKAFPLLSGDHKPQVATVTPYSSSWAAKVASSSGPEVQMTVTSAGDGDHCSSIETFPTLEVSSSFSIANKTVQSDNTVEGKETCAHTIVFEGDTLTESVEVPADNCLVTSGAEDIKLLVVEVSCDTNKQSIDDTSKQVVDDTSKQLVDDTNKQLVDDTSKQLIDDVPTVVSVNYSMSETVCIAPLLQNTRNSKMTRKTNKVVEFVGPSFQENESSNSNIQFGFGFDPSQPCEPSFEFGISRDILEQTSLSSSNQVGVLIANSVTSKVDPSTVDVLPKFLSLQAPISSNTETSYPHSMHKIIRMLRKG